MRSEYRLPTSWCHGTISEITYLNPKLDKSDLPDDLEISFVPMQAVQAESGLIDVTQTRKFAEVRKGYTPFIEGDVLFAKITPCMENGKMAVVPKVKNSIAFGSTEFHVLRARSGVNADYIYYYVSSQSFRREAEHNMSGAVGQRRVTTPYLSSCDVPLAPTNEQHRIVAKIEELFSELDKGVESLKTAREQLKVYRQALLKHAFEGKLTAQWRADNPDKLETADALLKRIQHERAQRYQQQLADWEASGKEGNKPKVPKPQLRLTTAELVELPVLPEGWGWVRLVEICEEVVDCHNKTAPYIASGIPLVRTPSIRDMKLIFDDSIRYVSTETYLFWSRRCPPLPGDILFTREAPMGEAAIIPEGKTICMGQRIMLLRPGRSLCRIYLLCATQAPTFKKIAGRAAVGTGVKHLRVGDVERLIIPICSHSEQMEISNQLDAILSEIDQLEQTITTSLQQAEALRQSILKKAFSGQLVPQDPSDEPASALLARIEAERVAAVAKPRKAATGDKLSPVENRLRP